MFPWVGRIVQAFVFIVVPLVLVRAEFVYHDTYRRGWEVPALGAVLLGLMLWCWANAHRTTLLHRWVRSANWRLSAQPRYASALSAARRRRSAVRTVTTIERNGTVVERTVTTRPEPRDPLAGETPVPFRLDRSAAEADLELIELDARSRASRVLDRAIEAIGWVSDRLNPRRAGKFDPPKSAREAILPPVVFGCGTELLVIAFVVTASTDPIAWLVAGLWAATTVALVVRTVQWARIDDALTRRAAALRTDLR
ncbi:hypothetical protein GCM10022261_24030 [Brevibacterium daeguense]|uniref:Transmembrane protein n=1 Tax=Brevibacterium daeguense TaxID=909936 RepID=A0ABP8EM59_9MICO